MVGGGGDDVVQLEELLFLRRLVEVTISTIPTIIKTTGMIKKKYKNFTSVLV